MTPRFAVEEPKLGVWQSHKVVDLRSATRNGPGIIAQCSNPAWARAIAHCLNYLDGNEFGPNQPMFPVPTIKPGGDHDS